MTEIIKPPQKKLGRDSWQCKVVEATKGNTTAFGAVIVAMLRQTPASGKRCFAHTATITANEYVCSDFTDSRGGFHKLAVICHVAELKDGLNRLADRCKLNDGERKELFDAARNWIEADYSPVGKGLKEVKS